MSSYFRLFVIHGNRHSFSLALHCIALYSCSCSCIIRYQLKHVSCRENEVGMQPHSRDSFFHHPLMEVIMEKLVINFSFTLTA